MFNVGVCYEHGLGVERNLPLARKWYCGLPCQGSQHSFRAKFAAASLRNGNQHLLTVSAPRSGHCCRYEDAAQKGHVAAIFNLACCHQKCVRVAIIATVYLSSYK